SRCPFLGPVMRPHDGLSPELRQRLDQAIAEFLSAVEAGRSPDREQFLSRHTDVAAHLRTFFEAYDEEKTVHGAADATLPLVAQSDTSRTGETLSQGVIDSYAPTLPATSQASRPRPQGSVQSLRGRRFG